jgi:hypothetical protein
LPKKKCKNKKKKAHMQKKCRKRNKKPQKESAPEA